MTNLVQIINVCSKCGRNFAGGEINPFGKVLLCNDCDPNYKEPITITISNDEVIWIEVNKIKEK